MVNKKQSLLVHSSRAGSGCQRPELLQVAVISRAGENPGSHMKVITEFSLVLILSKFTIIPFTGSLGALEQLTEREKSYIIIIYKLWS